MVPSIWKNGKKTLLARVGICSLKSSFWIITTSLGMVTYFSISRGQSIWLLFDRLVLKSGFTVQAVKYLWNYVYTKIDFKQFLNKLEVFCYGPK